MEPTSVWERLQEAFLPDCDCDDCSNNSKAMKKKVEEHPQLGEKLLQVCDLVESLRACMHALPLPNELRQKTGDGEEPLKVPAVSMIYFMGLIGSIRDPGIIGKELETRLDDSIRVFKLERDIWLGVLKASKQVPWA